MQDPIKTNVVDQPKGYSLLCYLKHPNGLKVRREAEVAMPSNYRQISLTSVCSKVMEHVVFHSIMEHLQNHSVLSDFQHGFRPGYSCHTQLIDFIENIQHAMDQQKRVDLILLDFSKAFDTNICLLNWHIMGLRVISINGLSFGFHSVLSVL